MKFSLGVLVLMAFGLSAIQIQAETSLGIDPYLWLEEVNGQKATEWVDLENARMATRLKGNPHYQPVVDEAVKILESKDKLPLIYMYAESVDNFWQDSVNPKGLWRRTTWKAFRSKEFKWDTILDFDALNRNEKTNYSYGGSNCLRPLYTKCMVYLTSAGSDAAEIREFDTETKTFVKDGFRVTHSQSKVVWIDKDTVYLSDGTDENVRTKSGSPRVVRIWKRGETISQAKIVFEVGKEDLGARVFRFDQGEMAQFVFARIDPLTELELKYLKEGKLLSIELPKYTRIIEIKDGVVVFQNEKILQGYDPGSILSTPLDLLLGGKLKITPIAISSSKHVIATVRVTDIGIYMNVIHNVRSKLELLTYNQDKWIAKDIQSPTDGSIVFEVSEDGSKLVFTYENMITPTVLYSYDVKKDSLSIIQSLPASFSSADLELTQNIVRSKDGTEVPYFLARKKSMKFDGKNPTILFGYGGFNISMLPIYMKLSGKLWLERGGVFAFANIRGGGEFGPQWHDMGKREKKQNVFDDFTAIAQDLIARKITSPQHLGIRGGSNGGLLVAASMTKHPELYKAVVCESPVLDMLRFHKLTAGPNWIDEFGNPDDPRDASFIRKYSPYENLKAKVKYPEVLFMTSRNDDRVHPGHARKMAAKLKDLGNSIIYYESTGGGHFNGTLKESAESMALSIIFFREKLGLK